MLGTPVILALLAVEALIAGAPTGLQNPWPFLILCLLGGIAFLAVGVAMLVGSFEFFSARSLEFAVSGLYVSIGLFGLVAALFTFALMNTCWVCI
ncbi:MAG TPA: hypothetical protein VIT43_15570 [Candidatus Dormibacteraeota bacterium]